MIKYVAVRADTISDLISDRSLQSADFQSGRTLASLMRGEGVEPPLLNLECVNAGEGLVVYGHDADEKKFVVFDLGQSGLSSVQSDYDVLQYVQRTLRFALKYWTKSVRSPNERIVSARTAVVFPFSMSQRNGTRIAIDLNPDVDRLARRGQSGKYLLVYKISKDEGAGADETSQVNVFRKFIDEVPPSLVVKKSSGGNSFAPSSEIQFLDAILEKTAKTVDIHQSYDTWLKLITESQQRVIFGSLDHPVRIEGPAGTGKTLTLVLRAIRALKEAEASGNDLQAIFFTHSDATRRSISTVVTAMAGEELISHQPRKNRLRIETLQSYCADLLQNEIASTEFVDMDAYDAKQLQLMYIESAIAEVEPEFSTYEKFMSGEFLDYWKSEAPEVKNYLVQHEIALVIKGRASEKLDVYKKIGRVKNGLPINSEGDKAFLWCIFESYRRQLVTGAQFDTDDVAISAVSQLSAPIWRRRRSREGYDAIFVDETHLFNMNELSVFHHLSRNEQTFPISYAVDRSQAIGDRGWSEDIDITSLIPDETGRSVEQSVSVKGIFRCSPDIVNLAFSITSSGATLFSNFEDPMNLSYSQMSFAEEKRARFPEFRLFASDELMLEEAFKIVEASREDQSSSQATAAIITLSDELLHSLAGYAEKTGRRFEIIKSRGDAEAVRKAVSDSKFVISLADYVGGLEFDEVVLVGIDAGRVPPTDLSTQAQSKAYLNFAAHNRLYVAVTRARYAVTILGVSERGPSSTLNAAFASGALKKVD
ncbi:UvrD-helicase domain-containing protein [Agrobacterium tumefaciens]|uniref:UvrD-helicase domain-containing protein n=1 Tax=Agrobacterium tumefaciens TaxID=358 RepID=UPI001571C93D|nr:UvrD-helicase domain-containing protein [Agrobacterium tumefaciens]NTD10804.1 UvrD-helicase domain-containing protein [Agrobacterium tumefaciens]